MVREPSTTIVIPIRKIFRLEAYFTPRHFDAMAKLILLTGLVVAYAYTAEIFLTWYSQEVPHLQGELNAILSFVEQLNEVNVDGVEPMTSVTPMTMKKRQDGVTDGGYPDKVLRNAPAREDNFFVVPKVVE